MDNAELLAQYTQTRHSRLRDRLILANKGLVAKAARSFAANCREPYEDLEQVGMMGLLKAIEGFDPSKGYRFSSYAMPKIRGAIQHYLRDRCEPIKIPRTWVDRGGKVARLTEQGLSDEAIAVATKVKAEDLPLLRQALKRRPLLSLESGRRGEGEDEESPIQIADHREHLNLVTIEQVLAMVDASPHDGYFDATSLCKKHQKRFVDFWRLPSTQQRVKDLEKVGFSHLLQSTRGRKGRSYLHVAIAVEFLSWVSPEYKNLLRQSAYGNLTQLYGNAG